MPYVLTKGQQRALTALTQQGLTANQVASRMNLSLDVIVALAPELPVEAKKTLTPREHARELYQQGALTKVIAQETGLATGSIARATSGLKRRKLAPSKYDDETKVKALCAAIITGSLSEAERTNGLPQGTVAHWKTDHPHLFEEAQKRVGAVKQSKVAEARAKLEADRQWEIREAVRLKPINDPILPTLSARNREVAELRLTGHSRGQIGDFLSISGERVRQIENICRVAGVRFPGDPVSMSREALEIAATDRPVKSKAMYNYRGELSEEERENRRQALVKARAVQAETRKW